MLRKILLLIIFALALPRQAASMHIDHKKVITCATVGTLSYFALKHGYNWWKRKLFTEKIELKINKYVLHEACEKGDFEKVKRFINAGADVNSAIRFRGVDRNTGTVTPFFVIVINPLHIAVDKGFKEITELLIDSGASIDEPGALGISPLHRAVIKNNIEIAELLIKKGATIDGQEELNFTPLHFAVKENKKAMVKLLLKHNADISKVNQLGVTSLHFAARNGYKDISEYLLTESFFLPGFDKKKDNFPLKNQCLKLLLRNQKDYNFLKNNFLKLEDWSADYIAEHIPLNIQRGIVKVWQEQKNDDQFDTLLCAHCNRHLSLVKLCLSTGDLAGVNPQDLARKQNYQEIEALLYHISQAESFSSLDKNLQEKIKTNIKRKLL